MEPLDDSHYLEPPSEPNWCKAHDHKIPCPYCYAEERD